MMRISPYFLKMLNSATKEFEVVAKYLPVKYFAGNSPKDFHTSATLFSCFNAGSIMNSMTKKF